MKDLDSFLREKDGDYIKSAGISAALAGRKEELHCSYDIQDKDKLERITEEEGR